MIRLCLFLFSTLLLTLHAERLEEKIAKNTPPQWMLEQISSDLASFPHNSITKEMIDRVMENKKLVKKEALVRCTITNNHLSYTFPEGYRTSNGLLLTLKGLLELCIRADLPDLDFVFSIKDYYHDHPDVPIPVLTYSKDPAIGSRSVLIPDSEALEGNYVLLHQVQHGISEFPWKKKKELAFWRGATTGGRYTKENYKKLPRTKLVDLSKQHPEIIDARFTTIITESDEVKEGLKSYLATPVSVFSHLQYKYQLLIDGHCSAFSRAYWQLNSKCLTFKQDSPYVQWFYGALKPNVHYIPVKRDLSDLLLQIQWAKKHDKDSRRIAKNAHIFFHEHLLRDDIYYYLYLVLQEYAKRQNF